MVKRIKFLDVQIKAMSATQLKMQEDMQALFKKSIKRANMLVVKATDKLEKINSIMEKAVANHNNLQRMVNLQRGQYKEIRKVVDASTKFEGLLEVVKNQSNDIEELKSSIETIQAHFVSHTIW